MTLSRERARAGTVRHIIPRGVLDGSDKALPEFPCTWCGEPTPILAEVPFRPEIGAIPMMLTCGAEMLRAWRAWQMGEQPLPEWLPGLRRIALLGNTHTEAIDCFCEPEVRRQVGGGEVLVHRT